MMTRLCSQSTQMQRPESFKIIKFTFCSSFYCVGFVYAIPFSSFCLPSLSLSLSVKRTNVPRNGAHPKLEQFKFYKAATPFPYQVLSTDSQKDLYCRFPLDGKRAFNWISENLILFRQFFKDEPPIVFVNLKQIFLYSRYGKS